MMKKILLLTLAFGVLSTTAARADGPDAGAATIDMSGDSRMNQGSSGMTTHDSSTDADPADDGAATYSVPSMDSGVSGDNTIEMVPAGTDAPAAPPVTTPADGDGN